jgi:hypothetical protein
MKKTTRKKTIAEALLKLAIDPSIRNEKFRPLTLISALHELAESIGALAEAVAQGDDENEE